jgi:hypothetical protein
MIRIDSLAKGDVVVLKFDGNGRKETALFCRIDGSGPERQAVFAQVGTGGYSYEWAAYRYGTRWAYGTSAGKLAIEEIVSRALV